MTRLVVIADGHAGHRAGLTPPDYQYSSGSHDATRRKFGIVQRKLWDWYAKTLAALQPIDCLVYNGDAIEGKGDKSGGTELITADRTDQIEMAAHAIREAKAKKVYVIAGTPYHTGADEDWEELLAGQVGAAHFGAHEWIDAEGIIFDFRHKIGTSVMPYGRHTAIARAGLWNDLWAERALQPKADVLIRSHAHYYIFNGDRNRVNFITPALQVYSKFGSRECEGTNDLGLLSFDISKGGYTWAAHLLETEWAAAHPLRA